MHALMAEEELDRMADQGIGWSPKVSLTRLVEDPLRGALPRSGFVERGTSRFYQIGRRGARRPIFIGLARGRSVAECLVEHLSGTIDGRATRSAQRLMLALRRPGCIADLWVTQTPVTAAGTDPTDPLSVQATLLLLQSRLGAEVVNPGSSTALPRSARGEGQRDDRAEAMARTIKKERDRRNTADDDTARVEPRKKSPKDYDKKNPLEQSEEIKKRKARLGRYGRPHQIQGDTGSDQAVNNYLPSANRPSGNDPDGQVKPPRRGHRMPPQPGRLRRSQRRR